MITLNGGVGHYIQLNDASYSYFAGNNYLGLANHPALVKEAIAALEKYGINVAAARQTTGTSCIHLELEKLLSGFKDRQDAVVFASGYLGNKVLMHVLRDRYSSVFADSLAHASIIDGIPKDVTAVGFYNHRDANHLEQLLQNPRNRRPLIITDGIFALTGEIAPLDQLYALARKYDALLIVDDAHATGVLGKSGRGTPEHFNLGSAENLYQSETMSKALGSYGGFIAGSHELIHKIRSTSAFYGASTALPPPLVAAGAASVNYIRQHPELRERLLDNARKLRAGITEEGFETSQEITPIIPVYFKEQEQALQLSAYLETNQIIAPAVTYPVKTDQFIVRMTVSACHTPDQIENLLSVLKKWKKNKRI